MTKTTTKQKNQILRKVLSFVRRGRNINLEAKTSQQESKEAEDVLCQINDIKK